MKKKNRGKVALDKHVKAMKKVKKNRTILAKFIHPGMVINCNPKEKEEHFHIILVTACSGFVEVEITHFGLQEAYGGRLCMTLNGEDEVIEIRGEQRLYVLEKIKDGIFKYFHDAEEDVNLIRLIEEIK